MNAQTKMSVKGQIVIPKDVRDALSWEQGMEFDIIQGRNSVTLKPVVAKRKTMTWEEFRRGLPKHEGPPIPESEWDEAIAEMFRKDWR
jgi:AbrB family looped-hinge helix DNA binding protein